MKHVLVISGSPRPGGNTYKITKFLEDKVCALGAATFEYLWLKDIDLGYCGGCLLCMRKGEERCPRRDDSIGLRDKMLAADGIIFASPVYVHTVSALMKNFYDRFAYLCHQPRFRDKAAMFIVTTELTGGRETLDYMRFPAFTWGFKIAAALDVVYPGFINGGKYRAQVLGQISRAAEQFHAALNSDHRPTLLRELMFFNLMKTKVTLHRKLLPRDYQYWKERGWLHKEFYNEDNIPGFKKALAKALVRLRVKKLVKSSGMETMSLSMKKAADRP